MGDGTTSVVLLAGEFLKAAKPFVEEGVHPQVGPLASALGRCLDCSVEQTLRPRTQLSSTNWCRTCRPTVKMAGEGCGQGNLAADLGASCG